MTDIFDKNLFGMGRPDDSDAEFIPLITQEEEDDMHNAKFPSDIPILPLRNNVLFPGVVIPITVGRDKSIELIQYANQSDKRSEEHTSELQSRPHLVCRLLLEKKNKKKNKKNKK